MQVEGTTVGDAMQRLVDQHAALKPHLYTDEGKLRSFVNLFLNDEDVRYMKQENTPVREGDTLSIIPSIAEARERRRTTTVTMVRDHENAVLPTLTPAEINRYSRHLIMPEVGMVGQQKLKAAKVLMVGAGGLGSPLGMYLAAAGVGTIGLVEFDIVDESNLQRQILFGLADVGRPKIEAAMERLNIVNPHVNLIPHQVRLESSNALDIVKDYDIVIDGTDNFPTRYLVNDACVLSGKPNVYGSIFRFEGQVSVFWAEKGPCYRCLYPEPPPPGSCRRAPRAACSACCPGSSARSRPTR